MGDDDTVSAVLYGTTIENPCGTKRPVLIQNILARLVDATVLIASKLRATAIAATETLTAPSLATDVITGLANSAIVRFPNILYNATGAAALHIEDASCVRVTRDLAVPGSFTTEAVIATTVTGRLVDKEDKWLPRTEFTPDAVLAISSPPLDDLKTALSRELVTQRATIADDLATTNVTARTISSKDVDAQIITCDTFVAKNIVTGLDPPSITANRVHFEGIEQAVGTFVVKTKDDTTKTLLCELMEGSDVAAIATPTMSTTTVADFGIFAKDGNLLGGKKITGTFTKVSNAVLEVSAIEGVAFADINVLYELVLFKRPTADISFDGKSLTLSTTLFGTVAPHPKVRLFYYEIKPSSSGILAADPNFVSATIHKFQVYPETADVSFDTTSEPGYVLYSSKTDASVMIEHKVLFYKCTTL